MEEQEGEQHAQQESSGSEPKKPPARRQSTRRALPRAAKAARPAKAPSQPGASANSSAASQDTSSPSLGRRSADGSPPAVASLTATPPAPDALSPSGAAHLLQPAAAPKAGMPGEGRLRPPRQLALSASGSGSMDTHEALAPQQLLPQLRPAQLQPTTQLAAPGLALQCARSVPLPVGPQLAPMPAVRAASLPEQPALGPSNADLDDVLAHLLTDDELRALHLGPLEVGTDGRGAMLRGVSLSSCRRLLCSARTAPAYSLVAAMPRATLHPCSPSWRPRRWAGR